MSLEPTPSRENFRSSLFTVEFLNDVFKKYTGLKLSSYVAHNGICTGHAIYKWQTVGIPNYILELLQREIQLSFLLGKSKKEDLKHLNDLWEEYKENGNKLIND
jgi:hypothetical protein